MYFERYLVTMSNEREPQEIRPARSETSVELTDPRSLRALAHPLRLELMAQLRSHGALTATQAGELVGESPGTCSYHLRQLAKWGLVEEAGGGRGRQRPWRATAAVTTWSPVQQADVAGAQQVLTRSVAAWHLARLSAWVDRRPTEPVAWQQAASMVDVALPLTAEELGALNADIRGVLEAWNTKVLERGCAEGVRLVQWVHWTHPLPNPEDSRGS